MCRQLRLDGCVLLCSVFKFDGCVAVVLLRLRERLDGCVLSVVVFGCVAVVLLCSMNDRVLRLHGRSGACVAAQTCSPKRIKYYQHVMRLLFWIVY